VERLVQTEEHDSAPTRRNIGWGCCNPSPQLLDWLIYVHLWGLRWQGQVPAGAASSPMNASKGMCPAAVALERQSERKQMRETCSNWTPRAQGLLCEQRQRDLAPAAEPQTLTNPAPAQSYGLRADKLRRVSVERTSADQGRGDEGRSHSAVAGIRWRRWLSGGVSGGSPRHGFFFWWKANAGILWVDEMRGLKGKV
jgi:hypothetical protein